MKNMIRNLMMAPAVLCASAAFAASTTTLNVPFSFTAQGKSYPAGQYTVSVDNNLKVATLTSRSDISKSIGSTLVPSNGNPSVPANVRLDFSTTVSGHELRRIRYGATSTVDLAKLTPRSSASATAPSGY